jgi:hypothetical protein
MSGNVVVAIGMFLFLGALTAAIIKEKSVKHPATGGGWFRAYLLFLGFALGTSILECLVGLINKWFSIDSYSVLFDFFAFGLLCTFFSGLILVIRRRGFVVSCALFLCGAFLTFGEFLGA